MKTLAALILGIVGIAISAGATILLMIYGWGLEPKSWLWILLITPGMHIVAQIIAQVAIGLRKENR